MPAPTPHADYGQPFRADYVTLPLGETPLLVTEVSQQRRGDKLAISFLERLDPQAPGRTVDVEFEPGLQQGLRQLLTLTLGQTDWNLPDTPQKPPEAPSPLNTPPRPAARATCTEGASAPKAGQARQALRASMPQRASAASSLTRASTHCAPCGVCSFFQNGAWVLR